MKKKIFLTFVMSVIFALTFVLMVSAATHAGKEVDTNATVTLDDGTVCNMFDSEGNSLIWYISGTDEEGKNVYSSIRADDSRVKWVSAGHDEAIDIHILLEDGTKYGKTTLVVVNMMDDDVRTNTPDNGTHTGYGKPICGFKFVFQGCSNLEYLYLRLDTTGIYRSAVTSCPKLKYVNLEDLTQLSRIGDSNNFNGCVSLFKGQMLDLSNTKLWSIDWDSSFKGVPLAGIKLPATMTRFGASFENSGLVTIFYPPNMASISGNMFKNCASLTTVYMNYKTTSIGDNAFLGCTALNTVFYVGSLDQLNELLKNVGSTGNDSFKEVAQNVISYADYMKLEDKSGKYLVYGFSTCEAYNNSNHTMEGNPVMQAVDYFKNIVFMDTCTICNCAYVDESLTINPLFTWKGFSVSEQADANGCYSVTQGFYVDMEAIKAYAAIKTDFAFGVVASVGKENPISIVDGEVVADSNVIFAPISKNANGELSVVHNYFDIKVTGIDENNLSTQIAFNGYVVDGGEIFYLHAGETSETAVGSSYNEVVK